MEGGESGESCGLSDQPLSIHQPDSAHSRYSPMDTTRVGTHALDRMQKLKVSNETSLSDPITQAPSEEIGKSGRLFSLCKGGHRVLVEFPQLPKDAEQTARRSKVVLYTRRRWVLGGVDRVSAPHRREN